MASRVDGEDRNPLEDACPEKSVRDADGERVPAREGPDERRGVRRVRVDDVEGRRRVGVDGELGARVRGVVVVVGLDGAMYGVGFWEVYRIDPNTAALTPLSVDPFPGEVFNSLTVRADGVLIGGIGSQFYEIDPNSGVRANLANAGAWSLAGDVVGLPDGLLYCLMNNTGIESDPTSLVSWDIDGGAPTVVGPTGQGAMFGVAYHIINDTIYGFTEGGQIVTIDPATGAGQIVSNSGIPFWGATTNPARWSG